MLGLKVQVALEDTYMNIQQSPCSLTISMSDLDELIPLAQGLIAAARVGTLAEISALLEKGAPAWYQDEDLGWSCLHYAAERREPAILQALIKGGAVWNAVDKWGRTAGEVCLSLGDAEGWEIVRNEGIRSGMSACPVGFDEDEREPTAHTVAGS